MLPKDLLADLEKHDGKRMSEILEKPIHEHQSPMQNHIWQLLQMANMQNQLGQQQLNAFGNQQYIGNI